MPNWLSHLAGPVEKKAAPQSLVTITSLGEANWGRRGFAALSAEGFLRNPIVHRCVRMIAEAAASRIYCGCPTQNTGSRPSSRSRSVPPPTAVRAAMKINPTKSNCWREATSAPVSAKITTAV
mgnify:CR=1 FL=1